MQRYLNLSGKSGIEAFRIEDKSISVQFKKGRVYQYSENPIGSQHIENMKELALAGQGLNTYISQNRDVYHGAVAIGGRELYR
ncbi:hypothetical protein [Pseudodesulfovibrio sp.]|uniref:hypothetical protein n=1 Tax=unclassified Pseudodesulfovibrio TaxID=2661612 RepID=UPI003B000058